MNSRVPLVVLLEVDLPGAILGMGIALRHGNVLRVSELELAGRDLSLVQVVSGRHAVDAQPREGVAQLQTAVDRLLGSLGALLALLALLMLLILSMLLTLLGLRRSGRDAFQVEVQVQVVGRVEDPGVDGRREADSGVHLLVTLHAFARARLFVRVGIHVCVGVESSLRVRIRVRMQWTRRRLRGQQRRGRKTRARIVRRLTAE